MNELLEQVLQLDVTDQLAIAVSLGLMELTNTFRERVDFTPISPSFAFGSLHGMSNSYIQTSQQAHDVMDAIRESEIYDKEAIALSIAILNNVREVGYE